jgi:hypothetical protein
VQAVEENAEVHLEHDLQTGWGRGHHDPREQSNTSAEGRVPLRSRR